MDFSLDGSKLYIANFGSSQISVVDIASQSLESSFFVDTEIGTWDGNPFSLAVLSGNRLAWTSEDQHNSIKLVDITTGEHLDDVNSYYQPYLVAGPNGDKLYVGESGSTGSQVFRFGIVADEIQQEDFSASSSASRFLQITDDGEYLFYRKSKILANSLQSIVGTFNENIHAINPSGSRALGMDNVYDAEQFSIISPMPIETSVSVFDPNGVTAYLFDLSTTRLYVVEID